MLRPGRRMVVLFAAQLPPSLVGLPWRWLYRLAGLQPPEGPPAGPSPTGGVEVEPWTFTDGAWTLYGILARRSPYL